MMTKTAPTNLDGAKIRSWIFDPATPGYAFLTLEEVLAAFDTTSRTLLDWRNSGFPQPVAIPGNRVYNVEAIREFLKEKQRESVRCTRAALK